MLRVTAAGARAAVAATAVFRRNAQYPPRFGGQGQGQGYGGQGQGQGPRRGANADTAMAEAMRSAIESEQHRAWWMRMRHAGKKKGKRRSETR